MDANQQELFRVVAKQLHDGDYLELALFLAVVYSPFVPVIIRDWWHRREIKQLYKDRLEDKDKEINRQADRIKGLENSFLKRRRP